MPGGSANAYDYANQDPLNQFDLDGRWAWGRHHRHKQSCNDSGKLRAGGRAVLGTLALAPYAMYYGSYRVRHGVHGWQKKHHRHWYSRWAGRAANIGTAGLMIPEAIGLGNDAGIDWVKGHTCACESVRDEGIQGSFLPSYLPKTWIHGYLPGFHAHGRGVDFE